MNEHGTQPSLLDPGFTPPPESAEQAWSGIAQVVVDSPLPHLDRPFDYGIPRELDKAAQVGSRVRIRFAGKNVDGFIIARRTRTDQAEVKPIRRVVGQAPVVTGAVLRLCQEVADRYAGGLADVLRLAIPPRHAAAEKRFLERLHEGTAPTPGSGTPTPRSPSDPPGEGPSLGVGAWQNFRAGPAFLRRLQAGESPRAVWSALPSARADELPQWARAISAASAATVASGRGVLILVPTAQEHHTMSEALAEAGLPVTELIADLGPAARYENFLTCLHGRAPIVLGTRAAAYAPVANLGLVVCWQEASDAFAEPRAPYPHARDIVALRAEQSGAGALIGGFSRTPHAEHLVTTSWAQHLGADRATVRRQTPRITTPDDFDLDREGAVGRARIPSFAWRQIRATLERGPVLIQVPRAGFVPALACAQCHRTARCAQCHGPLSSRHTAAPACSWCAAAPHNWSCPHCSGGSWRARSIGAKRTADELGRAFPGVPIRVSGGAAGRLDPVNDSPQLIIATPGAEPPALRGYPLAVLLDGHALTDLPYLHAPVAALHRWLRAAALTTAAGHVLILGHPLVAPAQAAVRWDPAGFARRELAEWTMLGFPPATTVVTVTGEKNDVSGFHRFLPEVPTLESIGPVPLSGPVRAPTDEELRIPVTSPRTRLLLRVEAQHHRELTRAVRAAVRIKSAKRDGQPINIRVNPTEAL